MTLLATRAAPPSLEERSVFGTVTIAGAGCLLGLILIINGETALKVFGLLVFLVTITIGGLIVVGTVKLNQQRSRDHRLAMMQWERTYVCLSCTKRFLENTPSTYN
jgi:hypothetical protein